MSLGGAVYTGWDLTLSGNEFKNNRALASGTAANYHTGDLGIVGLSGLPGSGGDGTNAQGADGSSSAGSQGALFNQSGEDSSIAHGGAIYHPLSRPIKNLSDSIFVNNFPDDIYPPNT